MRDFHTPGRSAVLATNGMCATSHPLAAATAIDTLRQGGNALDAALAGAVMLGLAEPAMTGIGGDLFALVSPAGSDDVIAVNGSGRAPKAATAADLRAKGMTKVDTDSAHSITVPGAIDAICAMSDRWGRVGLDRIFAPTIHYMDEGLPVAPRAAFDYAEAHGDLRGTARDIFLNNGQPMKTGDILRLPGQAEVLRRIAKDGRKAFYEGEIAEDMLSTLRALGGVHTAEDFANVETTFSAPLSATYKGRELLEHPPNGQGITAHLMLNILSHFDIPSMDPYGADRVHIEAEAAKLAYGLRNRHLADIDHMTEVDLFLDPKTAADLTSQIDPRRAMPVPMLTPENTHRDTICISVVDRDRMVVSLIYSIFNSFGSGHASDKFGILFHNRGSGFNLLEGHPNELAGGKRPMHSIIPAMLRDNGRVTMPFGVMGGQYQANGHAAFMTNITDFGMDPQTAIDAPRSFSMDGKSRTLVLDGKLRIERGYGETVMADLTARGHDLLVPNTAIGGAQAILIHDSGVLEGASDPRKDGCALGY